MLISLVFGLCAVIVMAILARTELNWLNGLIPLFPVLALAGQTSAFVSQGSAAAQNVARIGIYSLVPYLLYLVAVYFLSTSLGFPRAAMIGLVAWSVAACAVVYVAIGS